LFAVTLFISASLLFMVQPMVGKMILPLLGGSPAVWNACMVFFQALLLLGYLYAHYVSTRFEPKKQWAIHLLVLLGPIAAMVLSVVLGPRGTPIAVADSLAPGDETSPFLSVMALLTVAIGVPFFVSSTSAPLLQKWFAYTGHPSARDPYFLYAASNAGSLISLLGYPLFIEPNLTIAGQAWVWAIGFAVLVVFIFVCGRAAANPIGVPPLSAKIPVPAKAPAAAGAITMPPTPIEPPPSGLRIAKWIALAFVPSSLMLGVTFHMSTDIASIPLLWVIPLALYLVTFIIAFGRVPGWFRLVIGNLAPVVILLLVFTIVAREYLALGTAMDLALHITTFFAAALMCHYELARDRPRDVAHLTLYFLMMSVGGVLGGIFNALVAPVVFSSFPMALEYPITLVVACLLVPNLSPTVSNAADMGVSKLTAVALDAGVGVGVLNPIFYPFRLLFREVDRRERLARALDLVVPLILGVFFWLLTMLPEKVWFIELCKSISASLGRENPRPILAVLVFALPVMACFFFVDRPVRFALCVAVILGIHMYRDRDEDIVYTERSFFGILKVEERRYFTRLVHGTTLHGTQINKYYVLPADAPIPFGAFSPWDVVGLEGAIQAWDPKQEPLTYYHRTGPVGAMFHELRTRKGGADAKAHVAMIGLGTGSVSCYALPGQKLTFYEIDPAVKRLVADDDKYFSYVSDAKRRGAELDFRMGDARLKLKEATDQKYALLLVDAFSSDAIPVHLLTKEAVQLYMNRLTDDGILALHISNKYVRLEPVVAKIADELKIPARVWSDDSESRPGKTASSWVVLAKDEKTLGSLAAPATDQVVAFGTKNTALVELLKKYGPQADAKEALAREYGDSFGRAAAAPDGKEVGVAVEEFSKRHGGQAAVLVEYVRKFDLSKKALSLADLTEIVYGPMFHPVRLLDGVPLWTDDYSDVLRVIMIKEVQSVRKFFGLTVPVEE
jgi:hypothetical protein